MNKTKALLVVAVLGLLAAVLGVGALHWLDQGPLDSTVDLAQGQHRPDTDPNARPPMNAERTTALAWTVLTMNRPR